MSVPIPKARNIGVIGFTISRDDAPWGNPDWEIWACNNLHLHLRPEQRFDRLFDLHDAATVEADQPHVDWLKSTDIPVYMQEPVIRPDYKSAVPFPLTMLDRLYRDELKRFGWRYYTNSVSYMVALAIAALLPGIHRGEGGKIGLWGIDMATDSEYGSQRPCCEYWLGLAEGFGIEVFIADRADLLKTAMRYGETGEMTDFFAKLKGRSEELIARLNAENQNAGQMEQALRQNTDLRHQLTGALENNNYYLTRWFPSDANPRQGGDDPSMKATEPLPQQEEPSSGERAA